MMMGVPPLFGIEYAASYAAGPSVSLCTAVTPRNT